MSLKSSSLITNTHFCDLLEKNDDAKNKEEMTARGPNCSTINIYHFLEGFIRPQLTKLQQRFQTIETVYLYEISRG